MFSPLRQKSSLVIFVKVIETKMSFLSSLYLDRSLISIPQSPSYLISFTSKELNRKVHHFHLFYTRTKCIHSLEKYISRVKIRAFKYDGGLLKDLDIITLKLKAEDFTKTTKLVSMLIRTPESMHACCSLKKVQILDAVNLIDNSSCWNEHLMQIHPSSWITFGTRQMVHPQNHDCTNFTEKRFSQDSERKWIDGKIATHKFPPCSAGWVLAGLLRCPMCETVFFPSIPRGIRLKGRSSECEVLRLVQSLCCRKNLW